MLRNDFFLQYLAILVFLKDYKGNLRDLPGVEEDQKELVKVLSQYKQYVVTESKSVLEDIKDCVKHYEQKEFERVHFHFSGKKIYGLFGCQVSDSGHGKDGIRVETKEGLNSRQEPVELAQEASGECVIGNKFGGKADSIHDLKLELLKLKTEKITMTFDCCRTVTRDAVVDLR